MPGPGGHCPAAANPPNNDRFSAVARIPAGEMLERMRITRDHLWLLAGGAVVVTALIYYAVKPVAKLTFYEPAIITTTSTASDLASTTVG